MKAWPSVIHSFWTRLWKPLMVRKCGSMISWAKQDIRALKSLLSLSAKFLFVKIVWVVKVESIYLVRRQTLDVGLWPLPPDWPCGGKSWRGEAIGTRWEEIGTDCLVPKTFECCPMGSSTSRAVCTSWCKSRPVLASTCPAPKLKVHANWDETFLRVLTLCFPVA